MTTEFFIQNRRNLQGKMSDESIVILFSGEPAKKSADEYYPFTPNRNFYYMCGIDEPQVMALFVKEKGDWKEFLFIKRANPQEERWTGKTISKEEAIAQSGIEHVMYVDEFETMVHRHLTYGTIKSLGMDFERESFEEQPTRELVFANKCRERYPFVGVKNIHDHMACLRMIKTPEEIEMVREAIAVTKEGVEALMKHAKAGIYEYELEAYFDFTLKKRGIKDYAFKTIAAAGKNATVLHYEANDQIIPEGTMILFDLGAQFRYYNADISRTFPVSGKFTPRQRVFYEIVLGAQEKVLAAIKPGVTLRELNEIVKAHYYEELKLLGMVQKPEEVSRYYYHGVSHFLGLDTHDVGSGAMPLAPGMVITVEPGLYIEEEAIGIRIEDDVLITAEGKEVLSSDIIKTVSEIEEFMA